MTPVLHITKTVDSVDIHICSILKFFFVLWVVFCVLVLFFLFPLFLLFFVSDLLVLLVLFVFLVVLIWMLLLVLLLLVLVVLPVHVLVPDLFFFLFFFFFLLLLLLVLLLLLLLKKHCHCSFECGWCSWQEVRLPAPKTLANSWTEQLNTLWHGRAKWSPQFAPSEAIPATLEIFFGVLKKHETDGTILIIWVCLEIGHPLHPLVNHQFSILFLI